MEIQHITGPDSVPAGFSATREPQPEARELQQEEYSRQPRQAEESKGNYIDTYV